MGRYLAIIRDAYREAKASRILFLMLLASTIVIIAALSVGWWKTETYDVTLGDQNGKPRLGLSIKKNDPHGAAINSVSMNGPSQAVGYDLGCYLVKINEAPISSRDDVAAFMKTAKPGQQIVLTVQKPSLTVFGTSPLSAAFDPLVKLPTPAKLFTVVVLLQQWIVGFFGVFIALIVTAGSMPKFLETGSLHLVMSRPVSRFGVIFARYLGGLTFISLLSIYLLGGVLLVIQLRSGIWIPSAFWSIPILIFLFAQFYAFSTLVSIVTRNQIMTVIGACVFYAFAILINFANVGIETFASFGNAHAIQFIADGERLNVETAFIGRDGAPTRSSKLSQMSIGVENTDANDLKRFQPKHRSVGQLPTSQNNIVVISDQKITLVNRYDTSQRQKTDMRVSGQPKTIAVSPDGRFVTLATTSDLACYDLNEQLRLEWPKPSEFTTSLSSYSFIDEEKEPQFVATALGFHQNLAVIGLKSGKVRLASIRNGEDVHVLETEFKSAVAGIASAESTLVVVSQSGEAAVFSDLKSGKSKQRLNLVSEDIVAFAHNAAQRKFLIGTKSGRTILCKVEGKILKIDRELRGASDKILAVCFSEAGDRVAASDKRARITVWNTESGEVIETLELTGTLGTFRTIFNYTAFLLPRTKKLDLLTNELMSSALKDLKDEGAGRNRQVEPTSVKTAPIVVSATLFIFIVLGIGSMIFYSRDL